MEAESLTPGMAFGVDPSRKEKYSLRQSRYYSLADEISQLAETAKKRGQRLKLLDIGVKHGVSKRYLDVREHCEIIDYYGADLTISDKVHDRHQWKELYAGDLMRGYPQIPSDSFDVVICEQVLEHLRELSLAMATLSRVLKPGGTLIVGVPTYPHGVHLLRKHLVPLLDALNPWAKKRGHVQAFSLRSFTNLLAEHAGVEISNARGFRIVSGGLLKPLENKRWWWLLNRWLGAKLPGLCIEIQVVAKKPTSMEIRHASAA